MNTTAITPTTAAAPTPTSIIGAGSPGAGLVDPEVLDVGVVDVE